MGQSGHPPTHAPVVVGAGWAVFRNSSTTVLLALVAPVLVILYWYYFGLFVYNFICVSPYMYETSVLHENSSYKPGPKPSSVDFILSSHGNP